MADKLINLLKSRTVLIQAGNAVGTGTLIAPGVVLTCAHVIRHTQDRPDNIKVSLPNPTEPGQFIWEEVAQNIYLSKIYEEASNSDASITLKTEYPDVAVIEIAQKNHALLAFPFNEETTDTLQNKQFTAFGFQKREANLDRNVPQAVSLNYSGAQLDGVIKKLMFSNGLIRPGMSGAALMERETGEIIGLVHMTLSANDDLGAYVIPTETIWQVFKKWEETGANNLYSQLTSGELQRIIKKQYYKEYPRNPMLKKFGGRLIIFFIVLTLFIWWFLYHIGQPQHSGLFAIILVAINVLGIFLGNWLGADVQNETQKIKGTFGKWLLKPGILISALLIILALWSFNTSVWIYGNSEHDAAQVSIYPDKNSEDGYQKKIDSIGKIRFFMPVVFKGDSAKLVLEGKEPKFITLNPFSRNVLYYPRDFRPEPIILFRISPKFLGLINKFNFKIEINKANTTNNEHKFILVDSTLTNEGSLILGKRNVKFKKVQEDEWKKFFQDKIPTPMLNGWVKKWKTTRRFQDVDLNIGDTVKLTVYKKSDSTIMHKNSYAITADNTDTLIQLKPNTPNP
ncbi:hypothetical protein MHTCC0001_20780 [Flavobacteriaceae bacterium MHTCC 0001]